MKHLTDKQKLPEVKRRIRAILNNVVESDIKSDGVIFNNSHSIYFTIANKDGVMKGCVTKRVLK